MTPREDRGTEWVRGTAAGLKRAVGEDKPPTQPDPCGRTPRRMVPRGWRKAGIGGSRHHENKIKSRGMRAGGLRAEAPAGERRRGRSRAPTRERLCGTVHLRDIPSRILSGAWRLGPRASPDGDTRRHGRWLRGRARNSPSGGAWPTRRGMCPRSSTVQSTRLLSETLPVRVRPRAPHAPVA